MNKNTLIFSLTLLLTGNIVSQSLNNNLFKKQLKTIKINSNKIISLYDESGRGVILWEQDRKIKGFRFSHDKKKKLKKYKIRPSNKIKNFFISTINDYDFLINRKNVDCDNSVNAFTNFYATVVAEGKDYSNTFKSNCGTIKHREKIKLLFELLYD
ncbi:MAG: hypothetical protein JXQ93_11170 [Flavobacteriaceae bacterium]